LKSKIACCAAALALSAMGGAPVLAQGIPSAYPGMVEPGDGMALPPHEILTIVRSTGLEPLGRPVRQGPAYALRARDPSDGQEVRVIVDAQMGRIVRVVPVLMPRYGMPVIRPPGRVAMVPDGYGLPAGVVATAPPFDPAAPVGAPPLPRPRPKLVSNDAPANKPAGAAPAQAPAQAQAKDTQASETTGSVTRPANPAPAIEMAE
jgi:hypothetical protein